MATAKNWSAYRKVSPLEDAQYATVPLTGLTRSVHLQDAFLIYKKDRLIAHRIKSKSHVLQHKGNLGKVLWFSPTTSVDKNNMFGNVSFIINWTESKKLMGPNLYYLDQVITKTHIFTRVLLTSRNLDDYKKLSYGGDAALKQSEGSLYVANQCRYKGNHLEHVLEIAVEASTDLCRELYVKCRVVANDHSMANVMETNGHYLHSACHRYNFFNKKCPSPFNIYNTLVSVENKCPLLLARKPIVSLMARAESSTMDEDEDENEDEDEDENKDEIIGLSSYEKNYDDHEEPRYANVDNDNNEESEDEDVDVHARRYEPSPVRNVLVPRYEPSPARNVNVSRYEPGSSGRGNPMQQESDFSNGQKLALVAGAGVLAAGLTALFSAFGAQKRNK